jgi:hypothetical protein
MHSNRPIALEQDAINQSVTLYSQVMAGTSSWKVRQRRTLSNSVDLIHGCQSSPNRIWSVVVFYSLMSRIGACFQESALSGSEFAGGKASNRKRSVLAVPLALEIMVVLQAAEEGKHVSKRPTSVA